MLTLMEKHCFLNHQAGIIRSWKTLESQGILKFNSKSLGKVIEISYIHIHLHSSIKRINININIYFSCQQHFRIIQGNITAHNTASF